MPRLGGDSGAPEDSSRRGEATAYASSRGGGLGLTGIVMLIACTFILRNLFFTNYRDEVIETLKSSGKTDEQIERYVPKTAEERRQYVKDQKNTMEQMKKDVAFLLQEVHELRQIIGGNVTKESTGSGAGTAAKSKSENEVVEPK